MKNINSVRNATLLLGIICALVATDRMIGWLYTNNPNVKSNFIRLHPPQAQVLALGSSNMLSGFDPRVFTSCTGLSSYNLGVNHASFAEQKALLEVYLRYNVKPRFIVIGFHPADLSFTPGVFHSASLFYYRWDTIVNEALKSKDSLLYRLRKIPLIRYGINNHEVLPYAAQELYKLLSGHTSAYAKDGYLPGTDSSGFRGFNRAVVHFKGGVKSTLNAEDLAALKDLLDFICRKKIGCAIYLTPVYAEGRRYISGDAKQDIIKQWSGLEGNCRVLTVNDSLSSDRKNFYGIFHASPRGADVFSKELARQFSLTQ